MKCLEPQLSRFPNGCSWSVVLATVSLVLMSAGSWSPEFPGQQVSRELKDVVDGNQKFSFEIFPKLASHDENLIFSPLSISSAMGMAYAGAQKNTETQIARILHFPTNQAQCHLGMSSLLTALTNSTGGGIEFKIGNALLAQKNYQVSTNFLELCRKDYQAELELVDFLRSSEPARQNINAWSERLTRGKIKGLFAPGSVSPDTRLVLANAIYFKGQWATRFDKSKTQLRPFWFSANKAVPVSMMVGKATCLHFVDGDTQILDMPYQGSNFSMLLLLPNSREGLPALERRLDVEQVMKWFGSLRPAVVDVQMPRFKVSSEFALGPTLTKVGVVDAFDSSLADFSGMSVQRPLFINAVGHAALVEVDEEGTVAAAATGVSFGCSQQPPPATFIADHPFIFMVLHRSTRTVLFMGRVTNPSATL